MSTVLEYVSCEMSYWINFSIDFALQKIHNKSMRYLHFYFPFHSLVPPGKLNAAVCNMAGTSSYAPPKLTDFILTEKLGRGTYATVYKAYRKVS